MDNTAFRRKNNNRYLHSSVHESSRQHNIVAEKHESVAPLVKSEDNDFTSEQSEPDYTEYKNKNNTDQVPVTIFGERLYKQILDGKREERRLKASSKPNSETMNKISDECIVKSDKENGSRFSVNYNANESNSVAQSSNSGNN